VVPGQALLYPALHRRQPTQGACILKKTNRRHLRLRQRTPFAETRPFVHGEDILPDLTYEEHGVRIRGTRRCHAIGLEMGDCRQASIEGSHYCYYHDKLQRGVITPSVPAPEEADQRDGMALYPTWPLPREGYVLLSLPPRRQSFAA
jgi:hypothetical protein